MKKIDWHAGFVSAMKLEFIENEQDLIYDEEHPIANRAQRIDLLIIKNKAIVSNTPDLDEENKRYADNIMDIFTSANTELVKEQIKEPSMCNAVNELFADQIKEKDLIIADVKSQLADKDSQLADKDSQLADKEAELAAKDAIIAQLNARLEKIAKTH